MFTKAEERIRQREEEIRKMVEMEYKEKLEVLKSTFKIKLQRELIKEREDELSNTNPTKNRSELGCSGRISSSCSSSDTLRITLVSILL
jgi:hypothetical protein